jgi:hypothetical protein
VVMHRLRASLFVSLFIFEISFSAEVEDPFISIEISSLLPGLTTINPMEDLAIDWEGLALDSVAHCTSPGCPFMLLLIDEHVAKEVAVDLHRGGCSSTACNCSAEQHCLPVGRCCGGSIQFELVSGKHTVVLVLSRSRTLHREVTRSETLSLEVFGVVPGFNSVVDPWISGAAAFSASRLPAAATASVAAAGTNTSSKESTGGGIGGDDHAVLISTGHSVASDFPDAGGGVGGGGSDDDAPAPEPWRRHSSHECVGVDPQVAAAARARVCACVCACAFVCVLARECLRIQCGQAGWRRKHF